MKSFLKSSGIFLFIGIFSSCTTTLLTSSWTKDGYTGQTYKKILVVAVASKTSNRAAFEGAIVTEFAKKHVSAVSSLNVFPNSNMDKLALIPKEEIAQALKDKNIDGMLVVSLLDVKKEEQYVQGQTYTEPVTSYNNYHPSYNNQYYNNYNSYNNYYGYYSTVYNTVTEPGYYEEVTTYYLESNFYKVSDESLVWTAQSESVDPANIGKASKEYATVVVDGLLSDTVVKP